jgi:2-deoxy-D-gluconate 3-dehydrogenase
VAALRQAGGTAEAVAVNVAEETSCRAMVAETVAAFGRLDILINNAGIQIGKRPEEFALAEWNELLATNLTGAFIAAQGAYPEMKRQVGGKIINIGSMSRSSVAPPWRLTAQARVASSNSPGRSPSPGPPTTSR